jgi:hypothetical protein
MTQASENPWCYVAPEKSHVKTRYDWKAGERGRLLEPDTGRSTIHQCVVADVTVDVAPLLALYLADRLRGQALVDAHARYGVTNQGERCK